MMGFSSDEAVLAEAAKKMWAEWELSGALWDDKARADFEKDYLEELRPAVQGALQSLGQVRRLMEQAIRECS